MTSLFSLWQRQFGEKWGPALASPHLAGAKLPP